MATGSHVKPKSNTPRADYRCCQRVAGIDIEEDEDDTAEINEPWLYCSVPELLKHLEKREAELAEIKRLGGGSGEHA